MSKGSPVLIILWVLFNIVIVVPLAVYFYYTANQVFPVLVAVEDVDAPINPPTYERVELDHVVNDNEASTSARSSKPLTMMGSVRDIIRLMNRFVYPRGANISILRGFGWLFLWNMMKGLITFGAFNIPIVLGIPMQIIVPLAFTQLHILWVHTILVPSTSKPFWRRFVSFEKTKKTVALPMLLLLTVEAIVTRIMQFTYGMLKLTWKEMFPVPRPDKVGPFVAVLVILALFAISPLHILVARVEASLLSPDETTVIPLDPALSASHAEDGHLTLTEAYKTLKRTLVFRILFFYLKTVIITLAVTLLIVVGDFFLYIFFALISL